MTAAEIRRRRLANQGLAGTPHTTPKEIVARLGAVQGQDYAMAKWGLGARLPGTTEAAIEEALNGGEVIRTHILRPTWHLVSADDIRWMLELSAPRVKRGVAPMLRRLELDDKLLRRAYRIIERALSGGRHLTRAELMDRIAAAGINTDDLRSSSIMFAAELEGLVCNGRRRGNSLTYALLDERVPSAPKLTRDEALVELALRYFTGHGPATPHDFSWWSGLTVTDARRALEMIGSGLDSVTVDGISYWFPPTGSERKAKKKEMRRVHFLPAFDEYLVSYKDRGAALDPTVNKAVVTVNGIFRPIIVVEGKVTGMWKRTLGKTGAVVEASFFDPADAMTNEELAAAARPYGDYLGTDIEAVRVSSAGVAGGGR